MKKLTKKQRDEHWTRVMAAIDFDYTYLANSDCARIEVLARELDDYLVRERAFERSVIPDNGFSGIRRDPSELWAVLTGDEDDPERPSDWSHVTYAMGLFALRAYEMAFLHIRDAKASGYWVFSNKPERVEAAIAKYLFMEERLDRRVKRMIEFAPASCRELIRKHLDDTGHSLRTMKKITGDRLEAIKLLENK